jgi:hypothetical protein
MQLEDAGGNKGSEHPEGAENNGDSLLDSLSPISEDVSPMASEEYNAYYKELEDADKANGESSPPKQVSATLAGLYEDEEDDPEKTLPQAAIPDPVLPDAPPWFRSRRTDQPIGRAQNFQEGMAAETLMDIEGKNGEHFKQKRNPDQSNNPRGGGGSGSL